MLQLPFFGFSRSRALELIVFMLRDHSPHYFCCSRQIMICGRSIVRCPLTFAPAASTITTTFANSSERKPLSYSI